MTGAPARPPGRSAAATLTLLAALALTAPAQAAPKVHTIVIAHMAYGPAPSGLKVGDTVEWVNQDIFRHSATAKDGSFDLDLQPKARGRVRLARPGAITVFCRYHPGMTEKLVVAR